MANELFAQDTIGNTDYVVLRSKSTAELVLVADGSLEAASSTHWASNLYGYALTDPNSCGLFSGNLSPIPTTDDTYDVLFYRKAGANQAPSDEMFQVGITQVKGGVLVTREFDLIDAPNATAVEAIQSGLATETNATSNKNAILATTGSVYYVKGSLARETSGTPTDKYIFAFFKDDAPSTSGITDATLTVTDIADTVLINAASLTQVGSTESWQHAETSGLIVPPDAVSATVTWTQDAVSHSCTVTFGRDA